MKKSSSTKQKHRSKSGKTILNSLLLLTIVSAALLMVSYNFFNIKFNGPRTYTPVEQAALAASESISKIVIDTEDFGFVSLAYYKPTSSANIAEDGYSLPVRSINELIATNRLNLIVADKLNLPLIKEFAKRDHKVLLKLKDTLIFEIKNSLSENGIGKDKDGNEISPHEAAKQAYIEALSSQNKEPLLKPYSLKLELGCLKTGSVTNVGIPELQSASKLKQTQHIDKKYKSYTNIPYDNIDFVFGGIGKSIELINPNNWVETNNNLPYQIPTIVKATIHDDNSKSTTKAACAQPYSKLEYLPVSGSLTISFPDGPVPEIKMPKDIYENKQLKNPEIVPMKLLSSKGGDYPIDSSAYLESLNWPLNNTTNWQSTARVWQLALYDWIRRAGPKANIASIVNMQSVELDNPKPQNLLWKAPLIHGGQYLTLQPISSGITHIFEFDKDGIIDYRSKIIFPFPLYVASNNQLYGKGIAALSYSDIGEQVIYIPTNPEPKKIVLKAAWDAYIRDDIRIPGSKSGGKHGGEPLAMPVLSHILETDISNRLYGTSYVRPELMSLSEEQDSTARVYDKGKGIGFQPLIAPQSEFAESMVPKPPFVTPMPIGRGARPLYNASASAIDIRFRRQIDVSELNSELSTGYFGIVQEETR